MQLDEHRMEVKPKTGAGECRQRVTRTMLQGQEAAPRVTGGLGRPVESMPLPAWNVESGDNAYQAA